LTKAADTLVYSASHTLESTNTGDVKYVIQMTDPAGNVTTTDSATSTINVNSDPPALTAGTSIDALSNNTTPSYSFKSSEPGTVSITGTDVGLSAGDTISATDFDADADHTITFVFEGVKGNSMISISIKISSRNSISGT
jgi:hypothetical protein